MMIQLFSYSKMISPIHDPPHLEALTTYNTTTKGQTNEFQIESTPTFDPVDTEINDMTDPDNAANRLKCQKWLFDESSSFAQTDELNESNEPLETIDEMSTE